MVQLTDRLRRLAGEIPKGHITADIGTDHGLLPIFLYQQGISPHVILSDINAGPLQKARENIARYAPETAFDIRLGSGLETLQTGEADSVVIAGMGGLLMIRILAQDLAKTSQVAQFVLQPRNAPEKLRCWLLQAGFAITNESLVREGKYLCEIITARPPARILPALATGLAAAAATDLAAPADQGKSGAADWLDWEISPLLVQKQDPLLLEFIQRKITAEQKIMKAILTGKGSSEHSRYQEAEGRYQAFRHVYEQISGKGQR